MACLADINVSQGSVATHARCDRIFNDHLTANLPRNLPMKTIFKSVKIWQNYGHESMAPFFAHPVVSDQGTNVTQQSFPVVGLYSTNILGTIPPFTGVAYKSKLTGIRVDWYLPHVMTLARYQTTRLECLTRPERWHWVSHGGATIQP